MKTVLRARQTAGGLFRHLMGERDEMRRGTSPVRGWLQRLLVGHSLAVGLTVCCVWGSLALAQQSPSGSSGAAGGAAANSRPPITTLPGGIPLPREGEVVPVPRDVATSLGAPNPVGQGPHPDFAITRRNGEVFLYDPNDTGRRYRIDSSIPRVYPPHQMSEWFGSTRFHQYDRGRMTALEPYSPNPYLWGIGRMPGGHYWRPDDGLFPSAAREARIYKPGGGYEAFSVYDRETNPCKTYVELRQTGIERAVDQYVASIGILSGLKLPSRSTSAIELRQKGIERAVDQYSERVRQEQEDFKQIAQLTGRFVQAGVVVPPHLMEEMAAARCRCRAYLDTYTHSVTGMRRAQTPEDENRRLYTVISQAFGKEVAESLLVRLRGLESVQIPSGELPLTEEVFDLVYQSIEQLTSDFPRDEYGRVILPALSREQRERHDTWLVPLTQHLEALGREYMMQSARLNACNMMGPEALERSVFFKDEETAFEEKSFDDCELAQVARLQTRHYAALKPAAAAAGELRQIYPQDYERLIEKIKRDPNSLGETGLMEQGRFILMGKEHLIGHLRREQGIITVTVPETVTLGAGLQLNQLDSVATSLTALCEQTKAMQSGPVGEQLRSCRRVSQVQREIQEIQMKQQMILQRSGSFNQQRQMLQAVLPASVLAEQQLRAEIAMEVAKSMAEEDLREKQDELAQLQSVCMDGRPRINYEAGVTALQTGPCRDLEQAARTLDQATRRRAELNDAFGRLMSRSAVQGGDISQAAREGSQLQRQLQQAQREIQKQQARLPELERSCQAQLRQVASSPAVLATLRHANPYQPALPNVCESSIAGLVSRRKELVERYGSRLGSPELLQSDSGMRMALTSFEQEVEGVIKACELAPDPLQRRFACELRTANQLRTQATVNNLLSRIQSRLDFADKNTPREARTPAQVQQQVLTQALNAPVDLVILNELRVLQQRGFLPADLNLNPAGRTLRLADIREALTKLSQSLSNAESCDE